MRTWIFCVGATNPLYARVVKQRYAHWIFVTTTSAVEPSSVGALWNLPLWEQYCIPSATDLLHARGVKQRYAHMDLLLWCD